MNHTTIHYSRMIRAVATTQDVKRRNELAYLALYYAITGNEERSEMIRRVVRRLEGQAPERTPELQTVHA